MPIQNKKISRGRTIRSKRTRTNPHTQAHHLKRNTREGDRLRVGELGNIRENGADLGVSQGLAEGVFALPHERGRDAVLGRGAVEGLGVFDDAPALEAVLLPDAIDERHVVLDIVGLVEGHSRLFGVDNGSVERHFEYM